MAEQFTPGPWKLGNADIFVDGDDGDDRVICAIGTAGGFRSSVYSPIRANKPEGKANARLIAAAPDLYAVIEEWLTVGNNLADRKAVREKARAALSRASLVQIGVG